MSNARLIIMDDRSTLNPTQRARHLALMSSTTYDVVVIGGGVAGCGVALDASSRGLKVALVEQRDYGAGTSSRSSKLFHGGLRYLEQGNFKLVREALAERNLMLNQVCPHLVKPVPFLYPLTHALWERAYVGTGVLLYDFLASLADNPLPRHRHRSRRSTLMMAPALAPAKVRGSIQYWDAEVDDARHTMSVARTAASHGAHLASSARVVGLVFESGRVAGAKVVDLETGRHLEIRAATVVSAAGVWTDDVQAMAGDAGIDVRSSKGIHLVVRKSAIESTTGLILRTDQSVLFVIPWGEHWIVGTTDTPWSLHRSHPAASRSDIEYLIHWVNTVLSRPLGTDDIVGVFAGLRPLLKGESDMTSRLSREHGVLRTDSGLISIAGGKYTTYRIMARDAVDAAVEQLGKRVEASSTERIRLVGSERLDELNELVSRRPDLGQRLGSTGYRQAEVVYAVTHEGALHLDDVLTRRTRVSIKSIDRGVSVARDTAEIMGGELAWNSETVELEVAHYLARVAAERDSQTRPTDETADAARMGAADVRRGAGD